MKKDFLPKVITWFRLDEHVRKLKTSQELLEVRVEDLEDAPSGGIQSVTGDAVDNTDPLNPVITLPSGGGIQSVTGEAVDNNDPLNPVINGVAEVSGTAVEGGDPKYPVINKQDIQDVLTEGNITDKMLRIRDVLVGDAVDFAELNIDSLSVLKNIGNPSPDGMRLMYNKLTKIIFGDGFDYTFPDYDGEVRVVNSRTYKALLLQSGTGAPTAVVLENDLGFTPTFEYDSVGHYRVVSPTLLGFETVKTITTFSSNWTGSLTGNNLFISTYVDDERITLETWQDGVKVNNVLDYTPITIEVFN